tara:strand:+ start:270 stop:497 length:228 start_codon:yes stop_codon:yes gene_type:complete
MGTHRQKVNFEMGELVRVVDNTFQEGMSPTRVGVITGVGQDDSGFHTGVYEVLFASSEGTLKMQFWHKFLEKVVV